MAVKSVFTVEEISLLDGTKVTIRPLSIKAQRGFYKMLEAQRDLDEKAILTGSLDFVADLAIYCLGFMNETKDTTSEELEEIVDQDTALHIIKVCGGLDLADNSPKAMGMVEN